MEQWSSSPKWFGYILWKSLAFPISRHAHAPCAHPRARLSRDFIFSNFCGRNFVSREVTQRPRVKTKNRWFARSWLSFSNFQVSPQYLFCQTRILDQLKLLQLTSIFHLNTWTAECFERKFLRQFNFWASPHGFDQSDGFVGCAWFALSVFSRDGKFLLEAVGILSLSNYAWTAGLQIVSLGTHGLHYLFPFVGDFLLEAVGILSLSSYSRTLELDCFVRHA